MTLPWKSQKEAYEEALSYVKGRREGTITSVKTPWPKLNEATVDGFEWHSMIVVGGRPGAGKTAVKEQIVREVFKLNPTTNMRVLDFSLEMVGKASAIRNMSSAVGRSYKYICSAENKEQISDDNFNKCIEFARSVVKYPIDIIEEVESVARFEEIIVQYMNHHSSKKVVTNKEGNKVEITQYTNTIITLDHSILINEKNKIEMLYDLGATITKLKRRYPVIFIILSQLNRNIDHPERNEDGKYGNYILESDIFGADALLQHADLVLGLNRPGKQKIRLYGPDKYIIPNDSLLVMHVLKARNGVTGMMFFEAQFHKMQIVETVTPAQAETRIGRSN